MISALQTQQAIIVGQSYSAPMSQIFLGRNAPYLSGFKLNYASNASELVDAVVLSCQGRTDNAIEIFLITSRDWIIVAQAWNRLTSEMKREQKWAVKLLCANQNENKQLNHLVVEIEDHDPIILHNKIEIVNKRLKKTGSSVLATSRAPLVWCDVFGVVFLSGNHVDKIFCSLSLIHIIKVSEIIFLQIGSSDLHELIERDFWKQLFATEIPLVLTIRNDLSCTPLRLFDANDAESSTTLFVFPERILPLQRAYFLRAFDLLMGLNYKGISTAALVLGPDNSDLKHIHSALEIVSPCIFTHPLKKGDYPIHHYLIRKYENFRRKRMGIANGPPIRFSERCYKFATDHNTDLLRNAINDLPMLKNVIYTGAWFTPAIIKLKKSNPHLRWFCDTIDVFYILDSHSNMNESRFLYSATKEKNLELKLLNTSDGVIAMSEADANLFYEGGVSVKILTESGAFTYASRGFKVDQGPSDLVFGFIGSGNSNNEKCLYMIRTDWWPHIIQIYPDAKLYIAGGICKKDAALCLVNEYPGSVKLLGFVPILSKFYSSVSAMLSPIAVQGGLNFKSVEALVAGRPLITNELGSRCLGKGLKGINVIDSDNSNLQNIVANLLDIETQKKERIEIQKVALNRFGDYAAYSQLINQLSN